MTPALRARLVCALSVLWFGWVLSHAYVFSPQWHVHFTDAPIAGFPFWREAWSRTLRAGVGAVALWVAAWQLGRQLDRWLVPPDATRPERALFTLALGVLALSSLLRVLASIGAYRPAAVAVLVVVCVASRPRGVLMDLRTAMDDVRRSLRGYRLRSDHLWRMPAVLACGAALVAALAPETEYDALWYHLWLPRQWLAAGRLTDIVQEYPSLYPGGWELLNGAAMVVGGPVAARLLHFSCAPLAAAAGCLLARDMAPPVSRSLVAVVILTAPTFLWEASTAYVDLALTWFVTLAIVAAVRYHRSDARGWLVLSALLLGGAMSVKHLGLIALAVITLWLLGREVRRRDAGRAVATVAIFAIIALIIPLPSYARAYAHSGNPVFPEMYDLFGARPASRWSDDVETSLSRFKAHFGMGRTAVDLVRLPWNVTVHPARFGGTFGPVFLLLVPFAAVARNRRRLAVLAIGCAIYAAVWASPLGSFQLRLLLPIVPCLAVLAAAGATALVASAGGLFGRAGGAAVRVAIFALLLANLPPLMDWHDTERQGADGWLTHVLRGVPLGVVAGAESTDGYLARSVPTYRAWRAIDARTSPDARILTFAGGDHLYSHRARLWSDSAMATPITWGALAGDETRMLTAARQAGITHVLFDKRQASASDFRALAIASAETREHAFAPFYEDERTEVVRLVYPAPAEPSSGASDR